MPNQEGGFAPNFTPLATVDVESGLIVSAEVIANTDEDSHMIAAVEDVQEQFGLASPPPEMLADGLMATGEKLSACAQRSIALYSPIKGPSHADNPALREDPQQPVAAADRARLPVKRVKRSGKQYAQRDKQAFLDDEPADCYWCPEGKKLSDAGTTRETKRNGGVRERRRDKSSPDDCAACPLLAMCVQSQAKLRTIRREQYESLRESHALKMATEAAQEKYARRRHPGERPFAVIKQHFGARRFLLRGLSQVSQEWHWLATAFNLDRLFGLLRGGVGPPRVSLV